MLRDSGLLMANYDRLADLVGTHRELGLFKRFAKLNAKDILYMQAELIHLEAELERIELENARSGDADKEAFQVSVFDLKESAGTQKDLQWRKALEIREKLKAYSLFFTLILTDDADHASFCLKMMLSCSSLRSLGSKTRSTSILPCSENG